MPPDITILFDRPNRTYYPGESISGRVGLHNLRPFHVRELSLRWLGFCQTWDYKKGAKNTYLDRKVVLYKESDGKLPHTAVSFPFSVELPKDCPPTFKGEHGRVKYTLSAVVDCKWWANKVEEAEFLVSRKLTGLPPTVWVEPVTKITKNRAGCFMREEYIDVKATIPKLAFSCGESSEMHLSVRNGSSVPISRFFIFLVVRAHYHTAPVDFLCQPYTTDCPVFPDFKIDTKKPVEEIYWLHEGVAPYSLRDVTIPFAIPEAANVPSFESGLISVDYLLRGFYKLENGDVICAEFNVWVGEKGAEPEDGLSEMLANVFV
ncbi:CBN-ARRD-1 protein [Caenorhabditis brenneri]|uniref:CBN-ARRD-1 protein n=1 Tax=Caenorhabditis brenneri TaxID=135651 RepID=G0MN42_CAEBE|nr:CBN-ARRD-1 protein [Caenorhabditis brenneri]